MKAFFVENNVSSYSEKLKDPRWQRKRLEMMELASWSCESCGTQEKTLHVHHHQYFKGREPWDYEDAQLEVVCADCHAAEHALEDPLLYVASFVGSRSPFDRLTVASFIAGLSMQPPYDHLDADAYALGELFAFMPKPWSPATGSLSRDEIGALISAITRDHKGFSAILRDFVAKQENAS